MRFTSRVAASKVLTTRHSYSACINSAERLCYANFAGTAEHMTIESREITKVQYTRKSDILCLFALSDAVGKKGGDAY